MAIDVPLVFENEKLLWVVDDVLTVPECEEKIRFIESQNLIPSSENVGFRNQDRIILDSPEMAEDLFQRLKGKLPEMMGGLRVKRLNERLRFYRYNPNQRFQLHTDHWFRPNDHEISLLTVLVYFNDNFTGGETKFSGRVNDVIRPVQGRVAIFQHKLEHEGATVISGIKYALRTDVIYESCD